MVTASRVSLWGEEGGATVLAACAVAALLFVAGAVLALAGAVSVRHQAQSAADLAALAAAAAVPQDGADPCARARDVARRNGASVTQCAIDGWDVQVRVEVPVDAGWLSAGRRAVAVARAGPD